MVIRKILYFNSHPHEEDDAASRPLCKAIFISTHILTKRMTLVQQLPWQCSWYFNSHPHEEDDPFRNQKIVFQIHFNSHPHEEDDSWERVFNNIEDISTHILTKRMTTSFLSSVLPFTISTHILTKRMTKSKLINGSII